MNKIKISVITPCYNLQSHIGETLNSVLEQTFGREQIEIIVANDASTDNSLTILRAFEKAHPEIKVVDIENNQGPGNARNKALEHAQGEYIFFLDGDDHILPDTLEKVYQHAQLQQSDVTFYSYGLIEEIGAEPYAYRKDLALIEQLKGNKEELLRNFLAAEFDGSVIFSLIKRELIEKHHIRFPDGLHEDIPYIFECYLHAKTISTLDETVYLKKFRKESIINNLTHRQIDGLIDAWVACKEILIEEIGEQDFAQFQPAFHRGLVGCIASLLQKNMVFHADNSELRNHHFAYIYDRTKGLGEFSLNSLPTQSLKDKHFSHFFRVFYENDGIKSACQKFERHAIEMGIVDKGSFVRT